MEQQINEIRFKQLEKAIGEGAKNRLSRGQARLILGGANLLLILGLTQHWMLLDSIRAFILLFTLLYTAQFVLNALSAYFGSTGSVLVPNMDAVQTQTDWPFVSIVVVMYREAGVVWQSVLHLKKIQYPKDKYEVVYLLEDNDTETISRFHALMAKDGQWPENFRLFTHASEDGHRTKPAALQDLLAQDGLTKSELMVIYDAEDLPDLWQLKKAVVAFEEARKANPNVVCLQAKLEFANFPRNFLTRLFGLDYAKHYECTLPSFHRLGLFTPLGGTSNFFLTSVIRRFSWDRFNVTEDLDLGVRLKRMGLEVQVFDSTTWEQAVDSPTRWIRQRSRWIKGYIQTYLVHMRNPIALLRQLGMRNFLAFQLIVGWGSASALINPIFWILSLVYFFTHSPLIQSLFPGPVYALALLSFIGGNYLYAYISLEGAIRAGQDGSAIGAIVMPILYAPMVTIAAYRAVFELTASRRRAFHWAKTAHSEMEDVSTRIELVS